MDQKRIDELGVELGRSLAAVVQHSLSIAAEASKGAPLWVNVGTAAQSFTEPVGEEDTHKAIQERLEEADKARTEEADKARTEEKTEPKKTVRKRATRKTAKAEEPKKADLLAIKEIGQKIMAYKSEHPWVEEECAKAMGGKVLATLRESEIQPAYDALGKILNKLEGNEEPNGGMFA